MTNAERGGVDPLMDTGTARTAETDAIVAPAVDPAVPAGQMAGVPGAVGAPGTDRGKADQAKDQAKAQASEASGQAKQVASSAADHGREVADTAKEGAREVAGQASAELSHVAGEASNQVRQLAGQATTELKTQADTQAQRAAGSLHTLAGQFDALANGRPEEAGPVADYAQQLNRRLADLADHLDQRGVDGLVDDATRFARRKPGMFLAGAAAAGFLAARFVRGNQAAQDGTAVGTGTGTGYAGQGAGTGYRSASDIDLRPPGAALPAPDLEPIPGEAGRSDYGGR